jgi:mTERF domain-containing protein
MFWYSRRALLCPNLTFKTQTPSSFLHHLQHFSSSNQQQSFRVNYLVQNLGFSHETASRLSNQVHFKNSKKPDTILAFFKSYGFSNNHLFRIIKTRPDVLSFDLNKIILPKFNFLLSKGASKSDLVHIITKTPVILCQSLENTITPSYDFVKRFLLSDQSTIEFLKHCDRMIFSKNPFQNIQLLIQNGVPESKMVILLRNWYPIVAENPLFLNKAVMEVKELGFNPKSTVFIVALRAKVNSKSLWERKIDVFKKWGWSEENVVSAFVKHPWCMLSSVEKIEEVMKFFVNEMGWDSLVLAKYPVLFLHSLEKRVIPRAFVLKFLESKGLIKNAKLAEPFKVTESVFLKRYVTCYKEEASQLLKLYEDKKNVSNKVLKEGLRPRPVKRNQGSPRHDHGHQLHSTVSAI